MAAPDDAVPRNEPRELYPEWSSHPHRPHAPQAVKTARPSSVGMRLPRISPGGPVAPDARRTLVGLALAVVAIAIVVVAVLRPRRIAREPADMGPTRDLASPDAQLETAARARLKRDFPRLPVRVTVKDEVVVVRGRVPDVSTRERLLDDLRMTPGLKGVVDQTALEQDRGP